MAEVGTQVSSSAIKLINSTGVIDADTDEILGSGRHIVFSVPGAFTPTCSNNHLPGFLQSADELRAKQIERILCLAVNDPHVVKAWAETTGALGEIEFIADGNATFTKALGLDVDLSGGAMGIRAKRAALVINDGEIEAIFTEDQPGVVTSSGAPAILEYLG